ncbi:protein PTHB1-like [Pseudomyrmex gracilis]|uniref:protein PTHB1-like n=1 Tax=Pseudomyrmex gracilis TaxID=219809 RepID=UPI0009955646|nr:protein PTHB1-like [Pseudomyrmex gracilis]
MSGHYVTHSVCNSVEDLDRIIYDDSKHQNLHTLDLDCDYAAEILRQAHLKRMFVAPTKWLLLQDRRGRKIDNTRNVTLLGDDDSLTEIFQNLAVYPDSDVVLARRFDGDFLELTSVYRPSPQKSVIWENRGNWTITSGLKMRTFDVASARRRNLRQTALKSSIVITNPDTINHLTDFEDITVDTITKANYPWVFHLVNRMNATVSFIHVNSWGYREKNGSWNGMTGLLQRREIDIGTSMYMVADRMDVVQYVQLYTQTSSCFVFRRPLLSSVKNIFELPFQQNVWKAIAVFLLVVFCLLYLSMKWEHHVYQDASTKSAIYWKQINNDEPTVSDNFLIILGAVAQQGYSYEPYRISSRIVSLMLLLASLSLYASYTANIVALMQSTTDSIKTVSDLLYSSLILGVHDTVYNRHYFKSFQDPIRRKTYEQKIEPKGRTFSAWMSLEEGLRRVKNEHFAFHAPRGPTYQIMRQTYQEEEKCGITEIDYLNLIYPIFATPKQSPYLEILKTGMLRLQEYGLKHRDEHRLYPKKPVCSSQNSFITIGLTECYFALVTMGYGMLLSVVVLALELLWHKWQIRNMTEETTFHLNVEPCVKMSLFKTKEWWRTQCGVNESFDGRSLLITSLFGVERKDVVVVGSHSGYLRIYSPSSQWTDETKSPSGFKSSDLLIETQIGDCIIDIKAGRFVSGSQNIRLAILMPMKLVVYSILLNQGSVEHGDRCDLEVAYEHLLPRFPVFLTTGPFGGVQGRDFFCVQCLDGTLFFYEQETPTFSLILGNRLLPEPIVYVSRNDVFVTPNSSWILECYRYKSIAEFGNKDRTEGPKSLEPDWSYNIGEAVLDIDVVVLSSFEVAILVLGENNLYCLKDNCVSLKYAKRFDYKPLCFQAYVIEPDGKLMVLVIADTNTLMIYEGTTLKWSAQLPLTPVAVTRAHFQHLDGVIVVLSDEGQLEACYLGSEPSLFIAPPIHRRGYDYVAAEDELMELRKMTKKNKTSGVQLTDVTMDAELIMSVTVFLDAESRPRENQDNSKDTSDGHNLVCKLTIELSTYTTLHDVQVCVRVLEPFAAEKNCYVINNLCDRHVLRTKIYTTTDLPAISSDVRVTASYETADCGRVCVLQKTAQLPVKMILKTCPPENTSTFTATLKCSEPLVAFSQLFPELTGNVQKQSWNALGLQHVRTGSVVTIVSGATSNRYRIQSNDGLSMTLVVEQLLSRLENKAAGNLTTTIAQNHIQLVQTQMEAHFRNRQEVDRIASELELLSTQLRNIERKMLRAVRERSTRSLVASRLPFLLEATYRATFALLNDLAIAQAERKRTGHGLQCAVRLLLLLLRLNVNDDKYAMFEAAIGFEPQLRDELDWEEIADAGLSALLRSMSRKSSTIGHLDAKTTALNKMTSVKEFAKLKKRLVHAIERLDTYREDDMTENEQLEAAS